MSFISCSQSVEANSIKNTPSEKCLELLAKKISNDSDSLALDLDQLTVCNSDIDTFDVSYGGPYIIELVMKNREAGLSYSEFMKDLKSLKSKKMYTNYKEKTYNDYLLKRTVVKFENWKKDSQLLEEMGAPSEFIENYGQYVKTYADGVKTHAELSIEYRESIKED